MEMDINFKDRLGNDEYPICDLCEKSAYRGILNKQTKNLRYFCTDHFSYQLLNKKEKNHEKTNSLA